MADEKNTLARSTDAVHAGTHRERPHHTLAPSIAQTATFTFRDTADLVQYMQGQDAGGNSGDPAMAFTVPVEQYRPDYLVHAPTNYEKSYANITRPAGVAVTLDGNAVGGWVGIGNTGYEVARVTLNNNGDGNHEIKADDKVGITVYGYGQYTSYWYPGGLELKIIPQ